MYINRYSNFSREKYDQEKCENKFNIWRPYYINTDYVECQNNITRIIIEAKGKSRNLLENMQAI